MHNLYEKNTEQGTFIHPLSPEITASTFGVLQEGERFAQTWKARLSLDAEIRAISCHTKSKMWRDCLMRASRFEKSIFGVYHF